MKITKTQLKRLIKEELGDIDIPEWTPPKIMSKEEILNQSAAPAYVVTEWRGHGRGGSTPIYITSDEDAAIAVRDGLNSRSPGGRRRHGPNDLFNLEVWNGPGPGSPV